MDPLTQATTWRVVIVCVTVFLCWLVGWLAYVELKKKQMMFEERRLAIENGMTPPPLPAKQLAGWPGVRQRELELKAEERRLLIEKGVDVQSAAPPPKTRQDYLRRGVIATCTGAGIGVAYVGLSAWGPNVGGMGETLAWCLGLAPIVFLYGIGNLIYQRYAPEVPALEPMKKER